VFQMNKEKILEVLQMIADDQKNDAANFDGQPFNGRVVAERFGNQGAAIAALAMIIKEDLLSRDAEQRVHADEGSRPVK